LGCALPLSVLAACSPAPKTGALAGAVAATASLTATATPRPLAPAAPGVYVLTLQAVDLLSPVDGTVQHSYPYDNPGAAGTGIALSQMVITGGVVYVIAGNTPSGAVLLALRASDGGTLWQFIIPRSSSAPGVSVVGGVVFVAAWAVGFPGTFYAISAVDGHELWDVPVATIWPYATVAGRVVYLPVQPDDGHQQLLGLRATDGTQLRDYQVPVCGGLNTPAVDNGMVYL
jgi:outer membrane protein assembly factor BamB